MTKVYAKDIHDKDVVKSVFLVARKTPTKAKSGKPFLAVVLRDKTGDIDARVWEKVDELEPTFAKGDHVEIEGVATLFQGRPQLKIDALHKVPAEGLDAADFAQPHKPEPGDRHLGPIAEIVERIHDPHVKALLKSFLDDESFLAELRRAPAAKSIHHAYHGGLAEHTLSVMRLAQRMSDQYPMADRDLLVAGAFLHDIGKLRELTWERQTDYSDEGRLVGHLVIASEWIHERASKIEGFSPTLEAHLKHLVLSHHGTLEFGSPRLPQTLEAMLLHHIDELDSRVNSWLELMKRDSGDTWTDFQKLYDRHIYKGASPTVSAKTPVERRHRKDRQPRREAPPTEKTATETAAAPAEKLEHLEGVERPEKAPDAEVTSRERKERPPKKPEEKLTFKPFAALIASVPETAAPEATAEVTPAGEPSNGAPTAPPASEAGPSEPANGS